MNASNFYQQSEDALDDPLFIKFSKVFADSSLHRLNRKVRKFETAHPHLRLVSFDDFTRSVPVTGKYLFSDKSLQYSELLYKFKVYREIRYYEPEPLLAEWLTTIDEFAQNRQKNSNNIH